MSGNNNTSSIILKILYIFGGKIRNDNVKQIKYNIFL